MSVFVGYDNIFHFYRAGFSITRMSAEKIIILPILTYVAFFCMSVGAVTWVLLSEIFPTKIRGRAMGIATMSLWIACYILSQTFPWAHFDNRGRFILSLCRNMRYRICVLIFDCSRDQE